MKKCLIIFILAFTTQLQSADYIYRGIDVQTRRMSEHEKSRDFYKKALAKWSAYKPTTHLQLIIKNGKIKEYKEKLKHEKEIVSQCQRIIDTEKQKLGE